MKWRYFLPIGGFLYCLYYTSSLLDWHFIDNVDLVIHEAGHVVFSPFGYVLTVAGGSLFQIIVPLVFAGYFFIKRKHLSSSLILYWVAINIFNVSVYAGDAVKMELPLLTGDKDGHDWNQLLFYFNQLRHTAMISHIIFGLGILTICVALIYGLYAVKTEGQIENIYE